MILVAASAAAADAVVSTPGLTPSSNVTDFFCSSPGLLVELVPIDDDNVDEPKIRIIYSQVRST